MKSLSDILNKTPWWALLVTGFACLMALAAFVTPYHIIDYRGDGGTPEERRAIKREIDNTFAENAIDVARGVIHGMKRNTKDPERQAELDLALRGLEEAREELRDAGAEVMRAKRDALQQSRDAARSAARALEDAQREVENAMRHGNQNPEARKALEEALAAAREAERMVDEEYTKGKPRKRLKIGMSNAGEKPLIDIELDHAGPDSKPGVSVGVMPPVAGTTPRATAPKGPDAKSPPAPPAPPGPLAQLAPPAPQAPAVDPLPPEMRSKIRQNVTGDMYRIGIGAALALILLPMFVLAMIAKFFIDRSRAATRMADLKRKEAEHHRMSQQLTEAKLQALQAQVEPHFLYNTLASVQALTEVDPAQAHAMTGHLIQYLRNALPKMREGVSTVGQEIELVRAYLSILQMRMGKRLAFDIAVPESVESIAFPPLMLPSLVENAIKHGLEPQREGGTVRITAELVDGRLRVIVADTGRGFGETIGAGVGLANIRERLAALYGETAKLTLVENAPQGVVATIEVPTDGTRGAGTPPPAQASASSKSDASSKADAQPQGFGAAAPAGAAAGAAAAPVLPRTRSQRFLAALGAIERFWRKALTYFYFALVIVAGVFTLVGIIGVITETLPMTIDESFTGPGGALLGTAALMLGFAVVAFALAIVVAVIYGLGFLMVGVAVLTALVVLGAVSPILAPLVVIVLVIWWLMRKKEREAARVEPRVEPAMGTPERPL